MLLGPEIVELAGVPGPHHISGRIQLSEVGVAMQQGAGEKGNPSQELNSH
jgi:hypothetical protein